MSDQSDAAHQPTPSWIHPTRQSSMHLQWPKQEDQHSSSLQPQLQFMQMSGKEKYGMPYHYRITAFLDPSENANQAFLSPDQITALLKSTASLAIKLDPAPGGIDTGYRYFNGMITAVKMKGLVGTTKQCIYELTLEPALSLLKHNRHYRIFHQTCVLHLVEAVLKNAQSHLPNLQFESLIKERPTDEDYGFYESLIRPQFIQYGESDFDFIHRLMKSEGMVYYFRHDAAGHTMVISREEDKAQHQAKTEHTKTKGPLLHFGLPEVNTTQRHSHLWNYEVSHAHSASHVHGSRYDWQNASQLNKNQYEDDHPHAQTFKNWCHQYYYPLGKNKIDRQHPKDANGKAIPDQDEFHLEWDGWYCARSRYRTAINQAHRYQASTNHRSIKCGETFQLSSHPSQTENLSYLTLETSVLIGTEAFPIHQMNPELEGPRPDQLFHCQLRFQPATWPYYLEATYTPPRIYGYQTAFVTAMPTATSISTNTSTTGTVDATAFLEITVKFHWSDPSQSIKIKEQINNPQQLSAPVRVAQFWAGKNRGAVFTPRIGDEVVIAFHNGEPTEPIVIGSAYNTTNDPWLNPKAHPLVSGLSSRVLTEDTNHNIQHSQWLIDDQATSKTTGMQIRTINMPIPDLPCNFESSNLAGAMITDDVAGLSIFGSDQDKTDVKLTLNSGKDVYSVYAGNQELSANPLTDIKSLTSKMIYTQVGPFTTSKWTYYQNSHLSILADLKGYGMTSLATVGTTMSMNPFGIAMACPFGTIDMKAGTHFTTQDKALAVAELAGWTATMTTGFHNEFVDAPVLGYLASAMGGMAGLSGGLALLNFIKKKREKLQDPMTGQLNSRSRIQIKSNAIESSCSHNEKKGSYQLLTSQLATTTTYKGNAAARINLAPTDILHSTGLYDHKTKKITKMSSMYMDSKLYDLVIAKGQDKEETGFFFDKENQYIYSKFTERSMGMGAFSMGFKSPSGYLLLTKKGILMTAKVNDRTSKLMLGGGVAGIKANYSNICLGLGGIHLNTKANISISGQEVAANPAAEAALIAQIGEMMNTTSSKVKEATKAFEMKKNLEEKQSAYPQFWVDYQKSLQVTTPDELITEENLITNPKAMLKAAFKSMKNPFNPLSEDEVNSISF